MDDTNWIKGGSPPDVLPDGTDLRPYKRLAAAVIEQAVVDAMQNGSIEARKWLSADSYGLQFWCQWLGIHPNLVERITRWSHSPSRAQDSPRAVRS